MGNVWHVIWDIVYYVFYTSLIISRIVCQKHFFLPMRRLCYVCRIRQFYRKGAEFGRLDMVRKILYSTDYHRYVQKGLKHIENNVPYDMSHTPIEPPSWDLVSKWLSASCMKSRVRDLRYRLNSYFRMSKLHFAIICNTKYPQ